MDVLTDRYNRIICCSSSTLQHDRQNVNICKQQIPPASDKYININVIITLLLLLLSSSSLYYYYYMNIHSSNNIISILAIVILNIIIIIIIITIIIIIVIIIIIYIIIYCLIVIWTLFLHNILVFHRSMSDAIKSYP